MGVCIRMKHRWIGGPLMVAALTLAACAPTDAGGDAPTASPTTEADQAPSEAPESAAPSPTEYSMDEY